MPILKKTHFYRYRKNKTGVDIIPIEDRQVSVEIFSQFEEVKVDTKNMAR
jgi:hypothetical protein